MFSSLGRVMWHLFGGRRPLPTSLALMVDISEDRLAPDPDGHEHRLRRAMKAASEPEVLAPAPVDVAAAADDAPTAQAEEFSSDIEEPVSADMAPSDEIESAAPEQEFAPEREVLVEILEVAAADEVEAVAEGAVLDEAELDAELSSAEAEEPEPELVVAASHAEIDAFDTAQIVEDMSVTVMDEVPAVELATTLVEAAAVEGVEVAEAVEGQPPEEVVVAKKSKPKKASAKKTTKKKATKKRGAGKGKAAEADETLTDDIGEEDAAEDVSTPADSAMESPAP